MDPPSCSSRKAKCMISGCLFTVGSIRNIKTHHISTHTLALQLSVVVCSQQRSLQVHKYASTMRKPQILLHCVKQNQEREQDNPPKKDILFRSIMYNALYKKLISELRILYYCRLFTLQCKDTIPAVSLNIDFCCSCKVVFIEF